MLARNGTRVSMPKAKAHKLQTECNPVGGERSELLVDWGPLLVQSGRAASREVRRKTKMTPKLLVDKQW